MSAWFFVGVGLVVVNVLLLVAVMVSGARDGRSWRVEAKPTKEWKDVGYREDYYDGKSVNLGNSVQVRVLGPGGSSVLIAVVRLTDDDYDEQLQTALATARERATTLNAIGIGHD